MSDKLYSTSGCDQGGPVFIIRLERVTTETKDMRIIANSQAEAVEAALKMISSIDSADNAKEGSKALCHRTRIVSIGL